MNRFFEFSQTQTKTLSILAVIVVLGAGYGYIRDFYLRPSGAPQPWSKTANDEYRPTMILDLNFSPADSLELIPGIGPVLAERIISYRIEHGGFAEVDSLVKVSGIGPVKLEKIRRFVKVTNR